MQMELEGRQFYLEAAKKVQNAGVRQILEYLAESEKYHIEKFNEIYRDLEKDPAWTESMAAFNPPQHEPYICVWPWPRRARKPAARTISRPCAPAFKMEDCSIDYYTKLARESQEPPGPALLHERGP